MINHSLFSAYLVFIACFSPLAFAGTTPVLPNLSHIKDPANLINEEIERMDDLILCTQRSLEGQIKLKERIMEYQKVQKEYFKHSEDNEALFQLIKSAYRTLQCIKENHLEHTLDSEFVSELTVIAQVAMKRGIPKP